MRVIVFFDLPTLSAEEKRAYIKFRKFLIQDGYIMMQESVYCKLAMNQNKPSAGLVQVLTITEKQYSNIEMIVGENQSDIISTSERMIVL